ncbi:hypothetical protein ACE1SV_12160 [Streptomyces sennicomposti]
MEHLALALPFPVLAGEPGHLGQRLVVAAGVDQPAHVLARTARRLTGSVISSLDARSRFQAGVRAVRRGYLSADEE